MLLQQEDQVTTQSMVRTAFVVCALSLVSGCAAPPQQRGEGSTAAVSVSGIAVMPVVAAADDDVAVTPQAQQALLTGSKVMDGLLKETLAGRGKVRFIDAQTVGMGSFSLEKSRQLAKRQQCNLVLDVTLSRYSERDGGDYGVKQPAAVTFAYRLYEVDEGRVLCHGRFDERQQAVMENLLTLPKAQKRGLTWLTAEALARDGLQEKFGECSYLRGN